MDFMKAKGKIGGQHKFPRVLKGRTLRTGNFSEKQRPGLKLYHRAPNPVFLPNL
jgi:hypothetical protein